MRADHDQGRPLGRSTPPQARRTLLQGIGRPAAQDAPELHHRASLADQPGGLGRVGHRLPELVQPLQRPGTHGGEAGVGCYQHGPQPLDAAERAVGTRLQQRRIQEHAGGATDQDRADGPEQQAHPE